MMNTKGGPLETETETETNEELRIISYGGGVQSTALIVLAVQGRIGRVDAAVMANVGDDSEHPKTISYVRDVMRPWAAAQGFTVVEVNKTLRDGSIETVKGRIMKEGSRSIGIPVRMSNGAPGNRQCTADFKIRVIRKWAKRHPSKPLSCVSLIGISTDEIGRANNRRTDAFELVEYPLLDLGLDRSACAQIIRDAGLPVPPKSACYFCPFHTPQAWAEMRRDEPELFEDSAVLEDFINERRITLGKDHVFFTRFGKPLREAIGKAQSPLFFDGDFHSVGESGCDSGHCFT
jgi:hypothetical protein